MTSLRSDNSAHHPNNSMSYGWAASATTKTQTSSPSNPTTSHPDRSKTPQTTGNNNKHHSQSNHFTPTKDHFIPTIGDSSSTLLSSNNTTQHLSNSATSKEEHTLIESNLRDIYSPKVPGNNFPEISEAGAGPAIPKHQTAPPPKLPPPSYSFPLNQSIPGECDLNRGTPSCHQKKQEQFKGAEEVVTNLVPITTASHILVSEAALAQPIYTPPFYQVLCDMCLCCCCSPIRCAIGMVIVETIVAVYLFLNSAKGVYNSINDVHIISIIFLLLSIIFLIIQIIGLVTMLMALIKIQEKYVLPRLVIQFVFVLASFCALIFLGIYVSGSDHSVNRWISTQYQIYANEKFANTEERRIFEDEIKTYMKGLLAASVGTIIYYLIGFNMTGKVKNILTERSGLLPLHNQQNNQYVSVSQKENAVPQASAPTYSEGI